MTTPVELGNDTAKPPLGIRLLAALGSEPAWSTMTAEDLRAFRDAENRKRMSRVARVIPGLPDRRTVIRWQEIALADRVVCVRVHRPSATERDDLPLVLHVHGGGFVGTAAQCDWVNSHLAARLPAVVVSVEHRLLAPETPLAAAVDDGWDVLDDVVRHAARWGIDPARIAVFGESSGALIIALAAIGQGIRPGTAGAGAGQPCVDVTSTMFDYASITPYADSPTLTRAQMQLFLRLAVPPGTDPRPLSPLYADDLSGLAPALVVVPTLDPAADHGRRYARTPAARPGHLPVRPNIPSHARLPQHAGHGAAGQVARAEILGFLRHHLAR